MSTRIVLIAALAAGLVACHPRPVVVVKPREEALAEKCADFVRQGRLPELIDEHQRWIRDCEQAFLGPSDAETAKQRVRLALTFRGDGDLQRSVLPVSWYDVEPAARAEATQVERLREDGEALALAARWRREVLNDRGGALALACKGAQVSPDCYEAQRLCGDYVLLVREDLGAAVKRWQAAYPLAKSRKQQCEVVERLAAESLAPEQDMTGMSPSVVERCLERANARARRAELRAWKELVEARERLKDAAAGAVTGGAPPPASAQGGEK